MGGFGIQGLGEARKRHAMTKKKCEYKNLGRANENGNNQEPRQYRISDRWCRQGGGGQMGQVHIFLDLPAMGKSATNHKQRKGKNSFIHFLFSLKEKEESGRRDC